MYSGREASGKPLSTECYNFKDLFYFSLGVCVWLSMRVRRQCYGEQLPVWVLGPLGPLESFARVV